MVYFVSMCLGDRCNRTLTLRSKGRCAIKPRSAPELERYASLNY